MKAPGTIERVNGIMVVTLSEEEERDYERLSAEQRAYEMKVYTLKKAASEAIKQKNAAAKQLKTATAKWRVLAEKKFPNKATLTLNKPHNLL